MANGSLLALGFHGPVVGDHDGCLFARGFLKLVPSLVDMDQAPPFLFERNYIHIYIPQKVAPRKNEVAKGFEEEVVA